MKSLTTSVSIFLLFSLFTTASVPANGRDDRAAPHLATGVRTGEIEADRAIVWVRLTARAERLRDGKGPPKEEKKEKGGREKEKAGKKEESPEEKKAREAAERERRERRLELPEGWQVDELEGACPGAPGAARVLYSDRPAHAQATDWREATAERDFVLQFALADLRPGTLYHYRVETRGPSEEGGARFEGSFRTAPRETSGEPVTFTVVTGMMYRDLDHAEGFEIYRSMSELEPDFLVATGDTVYYDNEWPRARGTELARYHWHRMYSLPRIVDFHRRVPGYWIKDDHDTLDDDCWPGKASKRVAPLTFEEGQRIFREQVPMGDRTFRTVRWGQHLQVWLVEGRDFRSPNTAEDGPEKTIWGEEQIRWLKESLLASDATFRVLVSATPIVGPDRPKGKNDNHSNAAFRHEGEGFRRWASENLPERFYVVCGDRHWQYQSVDPTTALQEFSCGPASNKHAGGSPGFDPRYHRFHRVRGGFLSVTTGKEGEARPAIAFRFHDVAGRVVHEYREVAFEEADLAFEAASDGDDATRFGPLYDRLLGQARERLERRAVEVANLTDPDAIAERGARIRRTILDSFRGFPERTPLNPRVTGRVEREDHVMEKVIYESRPGFRVTANLYLPEGSEPPYPTVLFPCGHSSNGKAGTTYQTAGQELARRGFAVLIYDPIGQGERFQYLDDDGKPIIGGTTEHTVTGTAALLVGSNTAEVIVWDGIRGVDYLATRDDIDLDRLGCTGNSGGGTQTSYLMALEPRIRAAAPSCYLTTFRRLLETIGPQDAEQNFTGFIAAGLDHADFVHAFAPRPALICAASGDYFDIGGTWTTFREAKRIYGRIGFPELVDLVEVDAKHGYHPAIRQRVGRFFERTLMDRAPSEVVRQVPKGTVYPDEDLHCTETGQVVSALGGRTVADLWREREAELRRARRRRFGDMERAAWLRRVRELAAMEDAVGTPHVRRHGSVEAEGVTVEKLSWDAEFAATALLFRPSEERREDADNAEDGEKAKDGDEGKRPPVTVIASDGAKAGLASRLAGRARSGEVILAVDLPGYGKGSNEGERRSRWGHDWKAAFLGFHLRRPLAGIRADALRGAIALCRELTGSETVRVVGIGRAAVPALLAAVMEPSVASLRLEEALPSWASIVENGLHNGRLGNVVPGALEHFDLPLLRKAMKPREVEVARPVGPEGEPLEEWGF